MGTVAATAHEAVSSDVRFGYCNRAPELTPPLGIGEEYDAFMDSFLVVYGDNDDPHRRLKLSAGSRVKLASYGGEWTITLITDKRFVLSRGKHEMSLSWPVFSSELTVVLPNEMPTPTTQPPTNRHIWMGWGLESG